MTNLKKLATLPLCGALVSIAALTATNVYAQETEQEAVQVKHKVIQLKRSNNLPTTIEIEENGQVHVIKMNMDELQDDSALALKLQNLDEETRETVLSILKNSGKNLSGGMSEGLSFFSSTENKVIELSDIDINTERLSEHEVFVINNGDNVDFKGILKGHHNAVIKLIEKGQFSREELDQIRAALDAKY